MTERFSRTELLFGKEAFVKLRNTRVAVFGIGGVGGYAAEALVRAGVGNIDVFDGDAVSESNLNRQIVATVSAIGKPKTEVFKARALDINPELNVKCHQVFYTKENADEFDLDAYDYIIDAIDMVSAKVELIKRATGNGVPIISCMGAGNKIDPTKFEVADIYETSVCPLARVMRRELKNAGVKSLKVVYSREKAPNLDVHFLNNENFCRSNKLENIYDKDMSTEITSGESRNMDKVISPYYSSNVSEKKLLGEESNRQNLNVRVTRPPVGSLVTVVATAGLLLANEVILYIVNRDGRKY